MNFKKDTDIFERVSNEYERIKYSCKCGHKVVIPFFAKRNLCSWCGHWVYRDKKDEFKDRLTSQLKKG